MLRLVPQERLEITLPGFARPLVQAIHMLILTLPIVSSTVPPTMHMTRLISANLPVLLLFTKTQLHLNVSSNAQHTQLNT